MERALSELGGRLRYPPAPDLAPVVRASIEQRARQGRSRRPAVRRVAVLAAAVLLLLVGGVAVLSPAVRAELLRVLVLPGVRIVTGVPDEPAPPGPLGQGMRLGHPVSVATADERVGFRVRIPRALGDPDEAYLDRGAARVNLAWRARPGLPRAAETGLGVLLAQFRAGIDEGFIQKLASDSAVERAVVAGEEAWWVDGPHTVLLVGADGEPLPDSARTAGSTLLWERGGVTYRLESALDLDDARRIAESIPR